MAPSGTTSSIVEPSTDGTRSRQWLPLEQPETASPFELALSNNLEVLRDTLQEAQETSERLLALLERTTGTQKSQTTLAKLNKASKKASVKPGSPSDDPLSRQSSTRTTCEERAAKRARPRGVDSNEETAKRQASDTDWLN